MPTSIVRTVLDRGEGRRGRVGEAKAVLVPAAQICAFAVDWIERRAASGTDAARSVQDPAVEKPPGE